MLAKRIIPCLDVKDGRTVKGVNFVNLVDAGDPVELAVRYSEEGADELLFLDITASHEKRKTVVDMVSRVARNVNIPFTVGGGISNEEDAETILHSGADKVSVNSSAVKNPELISILARRFGSQCVVVAVDAKFENSRWEVYINGGRINTHLELFEWVKRAEDLGAGEILFTSMNHDGTRQGFAIEAISKMTQLLKIPVIASGGAGEKKHFLDVFKLANADAALAAGIFHYNNISIKELKSFLSQNNIIVRL